MNEQRTPEWYAKRCGKVTASRIGDLMAKTKTGYSTSRANYIAQLVAERLTGTVEPSYTNAAIQWGIDTEAQAREWYETETFQKVEQVDFVDAPSFGLSAGASPDGLVGEDGLIEIKCPNTATHIDTILGASIDKKYILQMQWQMYCTGRKWCDFMSFDPRMPEPLRSYVNRVERDEDMIAEICEEVRKALDEVNNKVSELNAISVNKKEVSA